ncbi:MAG TPA: asparagine synthase-related protein [Longimicrobiaceae bacterium]
MNGFVCVLCPDGSPGERALHPYARRLRLCTAGAPGPAPLAVLADGPFAAAATARPGALRPLLARHGRLRGAGDVRLDDRRGVAALSGADPRTASDLELVLAAWEARGEACVRALHGDFGFVVWDTREGALHAARDAFGVRTLYPAEAGGVLAVGSRLLALVDGGDFDEEYAADFMAAGFPATAATPYAGCRQLRQGEALTVRSGRTLRSWRHWHPDDVAPGETRPEGEVAEELRALLTEAVRTRVEGGGSTWAQLSGGLDSSSIVSLASSDSAVPPLGGTLTFTDTFLSADETRFSDAVVERWGLRNEKLGSFWLWQDDGTPPPAQDEPRRQWAFWARDRRATAVVRAAGGRVLLSGGGGDDYLTGDRSYVADLLAAGRLRAALAETARHAVARRESFWLALRRDGLHPLLPAGVRRRAGIGAAVPRFVLPDFSRRTGFAARMLGNEAPCGPHGRMHRSAAQSLEAISGALERGVWEDGIEMRYPFLHRPLVELGLRLPPAMLIRPGETKRVLRLAMRGVLPEAVRTRRGKMGPTARMDWSLAHESARLREMLRDPLVARAGWIDAAGLREAVERLGRGEREDRLVVHAVLAMETWMRVRSGRWEPSGATSSDTAVFRTARAAP